jgi:hypothetical protein
MSELVLLHPQRFDYLEPEPNMRGNPFFAALAKMNLDTIKAFLSLEFHRIDRYKLFSDQHITPQDHKDLCDAYIEILGDWNKSNATRYSLTAESRNIPDYGAVVEFMLRPGNEILQLFLILAGRVPADSQTFDHVIKILRDQGFCHVVYIQPSSWYHVQGNDGYTDAMIHSEEDEPSGHQSRVEKNDSNANSDDDNHSDSIYGS